MIKLTDQENFIIQTEIYEGENNNGFREGYEIFDYSNGSVFYGEWKNNS